ncbi:uncharacterized protein LOC142338527 [Convolutriloba macropyga]|uniref:uncharacterized protein LOC142338527 n=1 Tax=Convolutriloba macropyga TaxID=536237 RepID=UPI003F5243C5
MSKRRRKEQKQLLVSLATIYVTFLITWFPYAFLILIMGLKINFYSFMPLELLLILDLWAHLNSAMNFFIYGVTHSGFRKAYKQIAAKVIPCYNPDLSSDSKSQHSSASKCGTGGMGGGGYYRQKDRKDTDNSQTQLTT